MGWSRSCHRKKREKVYGTKFTDKSMRRELIAECGSDPFESEMHNEVAQEKLLDLNRTAAEKIADEEAAAATAAAKKMAAEEAAAAVMIAAEEAAAAAALVEGPAAAALVEGPAAAALVEGPAAAPGEVANGNTA